MAERQYIGARYVIKVYENSQNTGSAEWEANTSYEPFTMVTYQNSSYLSKKAVPANIGNPAANNSYWVVTGAYNGQIAQLQHDVAALGTRVDNINDNLEVITPEFFGAVGDGTTDDTTAMQNALNSAKIVYLSENKTYLISSVTVPDGHRIIGQGAIKFYSSEMTDGMILEGNNVVDGISITDGYNTLSSQYCAITGDESNNCSVINVKFNDIHFGYCIRFTKSDNLVINHNDIAHYSYAGIMLINGCRYSDVSYNIVYDGRGDFTNRYAISISGYYDVADRPAEEITCNYNKCVDITARWEGIDSHACKNCEFIGNLIQGFSRGIVLTNPTTPAPLTEMCKNVLIKNNTIISEAYSDISNGIMISNVNGENVEISNNSITCHDSGTYHTSAASAVNFRGGNDFTHKNIIISNNDIETESNGVAIVNAVNLMICNNNIHGMASLADSCINLNESRTKLTNVTIKNNILNPTNGKSYRGCGDVAEIILYQDNEDNGIYENAAYTTVPSASLNNLIKALERKGAFVPSTTGNEAGWLCVAANTWLTIVGTAV